jgi:L-2-hydroxycarboxylate dehydrogenase (NAD+)
MAVFPYEVLKEFTTAVFLSMNCSKADAQKATDVLLAADLRGVD